MSTLKFNPCGGGGQGETIGACGVVDVVGGKIKGWLAWRGLRRGGRGTGNRIQVAALVRRGVGRLAVAGGGCMGQHMVRRILRQKDRCWHRVFMDGSSKNVHMERDVP